MLPAVAAAAVGGRFPEETMLSPFDSGQGHFSVRASGLKNLGLEMFLATQPKRGLFYGRGEYRWRYRGKVDEAWAGKTLFLEWDEDEWVDEDEVARRVNEKLSPDEFRERRTQEREARAAELIAASDARRLFGMTRQRFEMYAKEDWPYRFPRPVASQPKRWRRGEVEEWFIERGLVTQFPSYGLVQHLRGQRKARQRVRMSFNDIVALRDSPLPQKAYERREWWREQVFRPLTSREVAWAVTEVDFAEEVVTFTRVRGG